MPVRTIENLELVGGALCIDFANTYNSNFSHEHDYLCSYGDLLEWSVKLKAISPEQATTLAERAAEDEDQATTTYAATRQLRSAVSDAFANVARELAPPASALQEIRELSGQGVSEADFQKDHEHFRLSWSESANLMAPLWMIAHSATELLLSEDLARVKECPGCGWLFVDRSKNKGRRWCNMNTCGARDKMRRYLKTLPR